MKLKNGQSPDFFSAQVTKARRFYLDLNPPRKAKLVVVCGGVEHCASDYAIQRKTFPFYSIEYVAHGRGELRLGRNKFDLQPGTVFSYGPKIQQRIVSDPKNPLIKYFADFAGSKSNQWLRHNNLPLGTVARIIPPTEIQSLFDEFIRNGERATQQSPELCLKLLDCIGIKLLESRAPLKGSDSLAFATYQKSRRYIQEHFQSLRTLLQISKELHLDVAYLCRLFQRYDHQSPYQYLTRLKMNAAASQLQQPGALVKNVAADAGFANAFHFSRAFKSVFGLSPDGFRKMR